MKAVISSTYDDKYLYFLPIVTYCWHKLGVGVVCFLPDTPRYETDNDSMFAVTNNKFALVCNTIFENINSTTTIAHFKAPEHKQATYAQCSRLYAACLDLPEDEILITSDVDMAVFKLPPYEEGFTVFGSDLVPDKQLPICYISAKVKDWRRVFNPENKTYQECLDGLLGHIETQHFRGNYWGKDQETAYNKIIPTQLIWNYHRARPSTQFASHRVDRDDINWRSYVDDFLVDAHLWRNGYEDGNFHNILELLQMKYPYDNFEWLVKYTEQYKNLLQ